MQNLSSEYEYFQKLKGILLPGLLNKRLIASRILSMVSRRFGSRILEVGCGVGSGMLGAYPKKVVGIDINKFAIEYCVQNGYKAFLINDHDAFPFPDCSFDVCLLDNVLEHIENPMHTINECLRVTTKKGRMIVVVPGQKGYRADADHKKFYAANDLALLDPRLRLRKLFSLPFIIKSQLISSIFASYCLVAIYQKITSED